MSYPFDPERGLVIVSAQLQGPTGNATLRLALDTGATSTVVDIDVLVSIGYDPTAALDLVRVTTGSGVESVPRIAVEKIVALGQERINFSVLCHTLPPSVTVHGVLGLDFLRGQRLVVDFRTGLITLDNQGMDREGR